MICDSGGGSDGALSSCLPYQKSCLDSSEPQFAKANAEHHLDATCMTSGRFVRHTHAHTDYAIFDVYLAIFMWL